MKASHQVKDRERHPRAPLLRERLEILATGLFNSSISSYDPFGVGVPWEAEMLLHEIGHVVVLRRREEMQGPVVWTDLSRFVDKALKALSRKIRQTNELDTLAAEVRLLDSMDAVDDLDVFLSDVAKNNLDILDLPVRVKSRVRKPNAVRDARVVAKTVHRLWRRHLA